MTRVLVWKVYREQRLVWGAMAALALGMMVLVLTLADRGTESSILPVLFTMIAYAYGLVVGAILLAGEREAGTATFLDLLPNKQLAVWQVKCATGAGLVLALVLFLYAILLANGAFRDPHSPAVLFGALVGFAFLGFSWGLFFSGRTKTAMGAILAAVVTMAVAAPLVIGLSLLSIWLLRRPYLPIWGVEALTINAMFGLLILVPIVASGLTRARVDRLRRLDAGQAVSNGGWRSQVAALLWLELRQAGKLFRWLAILALCAGSFLPIGVLAWPFLTLLLGVLAGVAIFAGEQTEGSARFLSEQRLPPGRVWAVKVGLHLLLAVGVALLLLIPAAARLVLQAYKVFQAIQSGITDKALKSDFDFLRPFLQLGPYFTLWLGYGFSVGCLCGLLLRKPVVAGVTAGGVSLLLVALWAPSLLVDGLHVWQIWGPPILLLITSRLLIWPWATGQLGSFKAVVMLTSALILTGLWLAGGIGYRVVEIPLVEDTLDLPGFEKALEAARKNEAGQRVNEVLTQIGKFMEPEAKTFDHQFLDVLNLGWPLLKPELNARLDTAFGQPWARSLAEIVHLPLGVVENLQGRTLAPPPGHFRQGPRYSGLAAKLLVVRGLQMQARGDPAAFVDNLAIGLALARQLDHLEPAFDFWGREVESIMLSGLGRWLERLGQQPDLLRRVLTLITGHFQSMQAEKADRLRANYLITQNTLNQPEAWVREDIMSLHQSDKPDQVLAAMVALSWQVPWEQARLQRLVRFMANKREVGSLPLPDPLKMTEDLFVQNLLDRKEIEEKTMWRVKELLVALRLYQAETGHPAKSLQELTPKILPSVPIDPGTGEPFIYRLSRGEKLTVAPGGPPSGRLPVAAGQGFLTTKEGHLVLVPLPAAK